MSDFGKIVGQYNFDKYITSKCELTSEFVKKNERLEEYLLNSTCDILKEIFSLLECKLHTIIDRKQDTK